MTSDSVIEINSSIGDQLRTTKGFGAYTDRASTLYNEHRISHIWFSRVQHGETNSPLSHSLSSKLLEQADSFLTYGGERLFPGSLTKRVVLTQVNLHPRVLHTTILNRMYRAKLIAGEPTVSRPSVSGTETAAGLSAYPSEQLCHFLIEEMAKQAQGPLQHSDISALVNSARDHIKNAVLGLFQIISESIQAEDNTNRRIISTHVPGIGMSFSEEVCRALNTRIRLPYYREYRFYEQLHQEICAALKSGTFDADHVKISLDVTGVLIISAAPSKSHGSDIAPKRKRASIVKHDMAIPSDAYLSYRPHL